MSSDKQKHTDNGRYQGTCHCGTVCFEIETDDVRAGLYRCNCTLCTKKAIIMKPTDKGCFTLKEGAASLTRYKWNQQIAEHFFCNICGVYTHHKRRTAPDQISVNFACLDDVASPVESEIGLVNGADLD